MLSTQARRELFFFVIRYSTARGLTITVSRLETDRFRMRG